MLGAPTYLPTHRIYPDCSRLAAWDPKFGAALRAGIQCSVLRIWATNQEERELVSKEEGDDMFVKWSAGKSGIACCGILIVVLSFTPWTGWANPGAGVKWASNSLACEKKPWVLNLSSLLELNVYPESEILHQQLAVSLFSAPPIVPDWMVIRPGVNMTKLTTITTIWSKSFLLELLEDTILLRMGCRSSEKVFAFLFHQTWNE